MMRGGATQLKRKKPKIGLLLLLGTVLGFTSEQANPYNGPIYVSAQVEVIGSTQGIVRFILSTEEALYYENGDIVCPQNVYIDFFEPDKKIAVKGRANSVYFFAKKNVYEFRGDVELRSLDKKKQLNTEELHWDPDREIVFTDKFCRVEAEDQVLMGEGLNAKQDLSYYYVSNPQGAIRFEPIK